MSKVFAFSTRVRRRASQCCTARLISGNGCSGNEVGKNTRTNKRKKEETPLEDEDGKHAWDGASVSTGRIRCTINSRRGQVSLPAYTHCYDISACGFEPDTAETALQSGAADVIAAGYHPISNPDLPRRIERRTCACNVPQNLQVRYAWLQ